ncbi:MAG: hypothetical protein AAGH15_01490 [Myxococcota bacterium]
MSDAAGTGSEPLSRWTVAKRRTVVGSLIGLLLASNAWHGYERFQESNRAGYRDSVTREFAHRLATTKRLCTVAVEGKSRAEVVAMLESEFPDVDVVSGEDTVGVEWLAVAIGDDDRATGCVVPEIVDGWRASGPVEFRQGS